MYSKYLGGDARALLRFNANANASVRITVLHCTIIKILILLRTSTVLNFLRTVPSNLRTKEVAVLPSLASVATARAWE